MASSTAILKRLRNYFGNECHYCGDPCNSRVGHPKQATKDHIVPKYFGGKNVFDNYVLACADCNSKRGNSLFECECMHCGPLIAEALANQDNIDHVFGGLMEFNKPMIFKHKVNGKWTVKLGTGRPQFESYEAALEAALTQPFHRSRQ